MDQPNYQLMTPIGARQKISNYKNLAPTLNAGDPNAARLGEHVFRYRGGFSWGGGVFRELSVDHQSSISVNHS